MAAPAARRLRAVALAERVVEEAEEGDADHVGDPAPQLGVEQVEVGAVVEEGERGERDQPGRGEDRARAGRPASRRGSSRARGRRRAARALRPGPRRPRPRPPAGTRPIPSQGVLFPCCPFVAPPPSPVRRRERARRPRSRGGDRRQQVGQQAVGRVLDAEAALGAEQGEDRARLCRRRRSTLSTLARSAASKNEIEDGSVSSRSAPTAVTAVASIPSMRPVSSRSVAERSSGFMSSGWSRTTIEPVEVGERGRWRGRRAGRAMRSSSGPAEHELPPDAGAEGLRPCPRSPRCRRSGCPPARWPAARASGGSRTTPTATSRRAGRVERVLDVVGDAVGKAAEGEHADAAAGEPLLDQRRVDPLGEVLGGARARASSSSARSRASSRSPVRLSSRFCWAPETTSSPNSEPIRMPIASARKMAAIEAAWYRALYPIAGRG